ncbi:MAG TPA: hypothetical protein VEK11_12515 [Thermoanaerobaculia bacterium]|jgi:hypothetical protein|nr:hypothetical protein [Thermoanaerobaculia bacterium]
MFIVAAVLTASLTLELDLTRLIRGAKADPKVTCGITTVGYRFRGQPGQSFRYAGDTWEIPREGWIELLADKRRTSYAIAGKTISLDDASPRDPFGFREVSLPSPDVLKGATK